MTDISKSPERNTFQKNGFLERQLEDGLTPENDEKTRKMLKWYEQWNDDDLRKEQDPEWQKNNLEYDLRSTEWILNKVRASESYAQNLYASMCNMQFQRLDVVPILKNQRWSCSWRHSGGIIADMLEKGDYIDWYCSGIRQGDFPDSVDIPFEMKKFVPEGTVTDEIREDLKKLGWIAIEWEEDE